MNSSIIHAPRRRAMNRRRARSLTVDRVFYISARQPLPHSSLARREFLAFFMHNSTANKAARWPSESGGIGGEIGMPLGARRADGSKRSPASVPAIRETSPRRKTIPGTSRGSGTAFLGGNIPAGSLFAPRFDGEISGKLNRRESRPKWSGYEESAKYILRFPSEAQ